MKYIYISTVLALTASGCSPYGETFDCPVGKGVSCKSVSQVNQMWNEQDTKQDYNKLVQRGTPKTLRVWKAPYTDEEGVEHEGHYIRVGDMS